MSCACDLLRLLSQEKPVRDEGRQDRARDWRPMKMRVQPKSSLSLLTGTLEQQHPPWGRGAELVYLNYISLFMACGGAPTFSCRGQASLSQNSTAARERGCQPGKGIWIGLHSLHLPVGGTFSLRFKRIYSGTMEYCVCVSCSVVSNSATPWTAACQAPLSMEFSRQEYWSGLSFWFTHSPCMVLQ